MKILVPVKRVPDADQKIVVRVDQSGVETGGVPFVVNPFDAIALEEAVRFREQESASAGSVEEILVVAIGDAECDEQLRTALAMGADRAVRVACDQDLDPWNAARIVYAVVRREAPDLILMGKQAVDSDNCQTGQFLAALLDWPQATFASRIVLEAGGLLVDRETDAGIERLDLPLPAVVTVDLRLNEPRYASLPGIMRARKKEIAQWSLPSLGVELEPRVRVLAIRSDQSSRKRILVGRSAELANSIRNVLKTS